MSAEDKKPLSCLDGLKILCKPYNIDKLVKNINLDTKQTFLQSLKSGSLVYLLKKTNVWCTIVQTLNNNSCILLYDNKLLMQHSPYKVILLGPSGELVKQSCKLEKTVCWKVPKRFIKWQCQSSIFNEDAPNVVFQTTQQVMEYLKEKQLKDKIQINYINTIYPNVRFSVIHKPQQTEKCQHNLCLYQFKHQLYCTPFSTCWAELPTIAINNPNVTYQATPFKFQRKTTFKKVLQNEKQHQESIPTFNKSLLTKKNNSCSINIVLKGTTLAFHLGLFDTFSEWKEICIELNKTNLFLWPHHDVDQNLRSIFISCPSNGNTFFATFNVRQHYQQSNHEMLQYKSLYAFLLQQYEAMKKRKEFLLEKVFQKLTLVQEMEPSSSNSTNTNGKIHLFTRCLKELQHVCNNQRLVYFQREDIFLHKFKLIFANFINTSFDNSFKIEIIADRNNVPFSIRSKPFDLDNLRVCLTGNEPFSFCLYDDTFDILQLLSLDKQTQIDILPCPLIANQNWHDLKWENVYCPGRYNNTNLSYLQHVATRSLELTQLLCNIYLDYSCWLANEFGLDSMNNRQTFNQLSYQCILKKALVVAGPLYHGPEKMKPYYDCFLRSFCHGGFSYSAKTELKLYDKLYPHIDSSPNVENIIELDVNSSYGAAASNSTNFPGGFCMAYFNNNTHPTNVYATDTSKRWSSFEFTTVFTIIHFYQNLDHVKIRSLFHNFAPLQLFKIGPYIIDLVVVLECVKTNKVVEIALYQLDGQYAHGCDICPPLKSYIGGKSLQEVRHSTHKRDEYIQTVLSQYTCPFTYQVVASCHDANFSQNKVVQIWKSTNDLKAISAGYSWLPKQELCLKQLEQIPADLTFQIVCKGKIHIENHELAQLVLQHFGEGILPCPKNADNVNNHSFENETCQDIVLTQEWYTFLTQHLNFETTHVTAIFIYKNCNIFPQVYQKLIQARHEAKVEQIHLLANMYKKLINVSCGYFGLNLNKQKMLQSKVFIINKLNKKVNILKHKFEPLGCIKNDEYFLKSYSCHNNKIWQKNKTHAGIFIHVIEQGKLQLYKKLLLILSMCQSHTVRLLYSNIDNLVLGLATNKSNLLPLLKPNHVEEYKEKFKASLFGNDPGKLKLEWSLDAFSDWSFITPRHCIYVVNKSNITKFSSINKDTIDNHTLYTLAQNMLKNKPTTIVQTRRTKKLFNLDKSTMSLQF